MRTVIYARFSSDNQNPRSVDDQIRVCRERAAREGWPVVGVFEDSAISGAAGIGEDQRPGLNAMLRLVAAGGVDQVLAESTDRLSRHVADAHTIRERIEFAGARLFTLFDGTVTPIVALVKGFTDAQFRSDLAARVKRGQRGSVQQGRAANNIAYGYRSDNRFNEKGEVVRGLRAIDEEKAEIVRRIFREYASGESAFAITGRLNAERIPPPGRGRFWNCSTVNGDTKNSHGILRNRLYIGVMVYGRTKVVTDPVTRKRRMRKNTDEAYTEQEVPHLRIIDQALWDQVQARLAGNLGKRPEHQRRSKHWLSGLGVCGVCGSSWVKSTGENWGCSRHRTGNDCSNRRMIVSRKYQQFVLADLKAGMLAPEVVSAYVREYHREFARQTASLSQNRTRLVRKLGEATRKMERLVAAFAEGGSEFAEIRTMLAAARDEKESLARELASLDALPEVLTLHPRLEEEYRRQVEQLEEALAMPEAQPEAIPRLRAMIARVIIRPNLEKKRGVTVEVVRQIDEILSLATTGKTAAELR